MDDFKLITKKIILDFDDQDISANSIDLDAIQKTLAKGEKLNPRPAMIKHKDDHVLVSFTVTKESSKLGFGS